MALDPRTLQLSTYGIAVFDFISALLISVVAIKMLITSVSWLSIFLLLFSVFWTSVIILLFVGIWKRRPNFVRGWIMFSCFGILMEFGLILYGIFEKAQVDTERMKGVMLLFIGLVVESIFVYIVYKFYVALKNDCIPRRACACFRKSKDKPKKSKKTSKKSKKSKRPKKAKKPKKDKKPKCPPEPKKKKKPKRK